MYNMRILKSLVEKIGDYQINYLTNGEDPRSFQPLFPRHRHLLRPYCPQLTKPEIMEHLWNKL